MANYRDFPKGDARRYFAVLLAVDNLKKDATLHYVAERIGCTRAEVQRSIQALTEEFDVIFERHETAYLIHSWGVLKKAAVIEFIETGN